MQGLKIFTTEVNQMQLDSCMVLANWSQSDTNTARQPVLCNLNHVIKMHSNHHINY